MAETEAVLIPKRGSALLVIAIIIVATSTFIVFFPRSNLRHLQVRVAVIDSGINHEEELHSRIIAEKSFITLENNYNSTDNSTEDSYPNGNLHGTFVARIIAEDTIDAALINAKVVTPKNEATEAGIINAIYWAVLEE
ncbi:MAG: S8 family serine peptidase, partial [Candidatus Thorarchaeota archaeon]